MNLRNTIKTAAFSLIFLIAGCGDFLDVNPDDMLLEKDSYSSVNEVYSNFMGLTTALGPAAEQAIIVSELLGDLMEPTVNAPEKYWEIWRYEAGTNNDVVNPAPFYNVVVQVNDFLRHVIAYNEKNPKAIKEEYYKGMISSALADLTWAYLNIGKFHGEAAFHDLALSSEIDLSKAEMLSFDDLVARLIDLMNNGIDGINGFWPLSWPDILNNTDYSWNRMGINPDAVMSELYMWHGNYVEAARHLTRTLAGQGVINNNGSSTRWLLQADFEGSKWANLWGGTFTSSAISNEAISAIPYDNTQNQTNNLQYWFSKETPNVYYFKPTESLQEKYKNGKMLNKADGDYRMFSTILDDGNDLSIYKYTKGRKAYEHDSYIYVYRAAELWLMLSETMNQLGDVAAADSLLNTGLKSSWDGSKLVFPFDAPTFTQNSSVMRAYLGVRGRASQKPNYLKNFVEENAPLERKQFVIDSLIAEEVGLEQAFEGKKWFTLLRMARNSNHPEILADMISKKFPEGEREKYRQYLLNPANWFIKYNHLTVEE